MPYPFIAAAVKATGTIGLGYAAKGVAVQGFSQAGVKGVMASARGIKAGAYVGRGAKGFAVQSKFLDVAGSTFAGRTQISGRVKPAAIALVANQFNQRRRAKAKKRKKD